MPLPDITGFFNGISNFIDNAFKEHWHWYLIIGGIILIIYFIFF